MASGVQQDVYHACIRFLLDHKIVKEGPDSDAAKFSESISSIERQEATLHVLMTELAEKALRTVMRPTRYIEDLLDALLTFAWYQYWTKPAVDLIQIVVKIATKFRDTVREAEANFCWASNLYQLNNYQEAFPIFQVANGQMVGHKLAMSPIRCVTAGFGTIRSLAWVGVEVQPLADQIGEFEIPTAGLSDAKNREALDLHAAALVMRGDLRYIAGKPEEAYENYAKAIQPLTELHHSVQLAYCQFGMARVLGLMGRFEEALELVEGAIVIQERYSIKGDVIYSLIVKARCLKALGCWGDELPRVLFSALSRAHAFAAPLAIAKVQEELGEYYRREDCLAARLAYTGALHACRGMSNTVSSEIVKRSQFNLDILRSTLAGQQTANPPVW